MGIWGNYEVLKFNYPIALKIFLKKGSFIVPILRKYLYINVGNGYFISSYMTLQWWECDPLLRLHSGFLATLF